MSSNDVNQASTSNNGPTSIISNYLNLPKPASKPSNSVQNQGQHQLLSHDELTDLRAAQRTFDMAYARTALGELAYSVVVLKLFQEEFYYIG